MDMYTELHFNSELKDIPDDVFRVLKYMVGGSEFELKDLNLPSHHFFETERWPMLFTCDSYYFDADTHSTLRYDEIGECRYLCVRANLKNYDDEIKLFLDWIMPYLAKDEGDFLGFYRYEEDEFPVWIHKRGK